MRFDRIAILDWSAGKGRKLGKDSIWLSTISRSGCTAENLPTRASAEAALCHLVEDSLSRGERLLLGADFAFGAPAGFVAHLTGEAMALSWWAWLADRVADSSGNISNYRQVAAEMNAHFRGGGPFWGNGEKLPTTGLPRLKPALPEGLATHRATDLAARGAGSWPKPVWQLAGAGAVGAQVLTGLPVMHRLRRRFGTGLAVWPFEPPTKSVVVAEVYPSMLSSAVRQMVGTSAMVTDEAQVRLLATALFSLPDIGMLFGTAPHSIEEGWILGAGQSDVLHSALVSALADQEHMQRSVLI
jgi:hypothetical protein